MAGWTSGWLHCPAKDPEGFSCFLMPSHAGPHQWGRCEGTDAQGNRCILPPDHPGDHELAWYARPTAPGATYSIKYPGRPDLASTQARGDAEVFAAHGWHAVSETHAASSGLLGRVFRPSKDLVVTYEYRPQATAGTVPRS